VAYALGALLTTDTPMRETGAAWFRLAAEVAARVPDPVNPIMPLVGPLGRMFGMSDPGQGPPHPEIFDDAVANPHPWVSAIARILRAHTALNIGQGHAQAEEDFLAATGILATIGERWGQAVALSGLAMLEGWRGEPAAAVGHYRRAIQFAAAFGSTEDEVTFRLFTVRPLWLLGEREAAWAELRRAQPDAERLGLPEVVALAAYIAGDLARLDGQPDAARPALLRAVHVASPQDVALQLRAVASTGLGYLAGAEGDLDAARDWLRRGLPARPPCHPGYAGRFRHTRRLKARTASGANTTVNAAAYSSDSTAGLPAGPDTMSPTGLCLTCTSVRQLSESVCRSPSSGRTGGASPWGAVTLTATALMRHSPRGYGGRSARGTPRQGWSRAG